MAKFKKKNRASVEISTSSLPDIIFILLFFFMVATQLRERTIKVEQQLPQAIQPQKLENKSLVSYVYIGKPRNPGAYGTEPKIQVNDVFVSPDEIIQFVEAERSKLDEGQKNKIIISLKADQDVDMGILTDVKTNLRKANARKLNYSTRQGSDNNN